MQGGIKALRMWKDSCTDEPETRKWSFEQSKENAVARVEEWWVVGLFVCLF